MTDTWNDRDLPVLRAAVSIFDENGRPAQTRELAEKCGFDLGTAVRAIRARGVEPFFEVAEDYDGYVSIAGPPTGHALRVKGQWPSPESQFGKHNQRVGDRR